MLYFSIQHVRAEREKYNLACEAGCGVTVSFSDHGRILVGSCSDRSRIVNDISAFLEKFL